MSIYRPFISFDLKLATVKNAEKENIIFVRIDIYEVVM